MAAEGGKPLHLDRNRDLQVALYALGASGARLFTTLITTLEQTGGRYGLQTMCEGGGQANVTIIERL